MNLTYETGFEDIPKEQKTWGMLCHLMALSTYIGIPFGGILGPLVMWLIKKDESPFVDSCGREVLNFQITMCIAFLICIPLCLIFIGFVLMTGLAIYSLILTIIGAMKANDGIDYRYPFCLRFL